MHRTPSQMAAAVRRWPSAKNLAALMDCLWGGRAWVAGFCSRGGAELLLEVRRV
jgi:hypothetical protein